MSAVRALLADIIDYAGLFPPSALPLASALDNYAFYTRHRHAWMLARFVLPLHLLGQVKLPPRVTVVVNGENVELPPLPPQVESIEVAGSLANPPTCRVFHEVDWRGDFESRMPDRGSVKLRTGGLTPETVPPAEVVARFLLAAARRKLAIKFTAGLHVPVPNDDTSVGARMHGFLNVFLAACAAYRGGADAAALTRLLTEADYASLHVTAREIRVGDLVISTDEIETLRREYVVSFGSCSFVEPVEELERHGVLQSM